ncbi:CUSOD2.2 family protein [Megaselia abdita]
MKLLFIAVVLALGIFHHVTSVTPTKAVAVLGNGYEGVGGVITFIQVDCYTPILLYIRLRGLTPGLHGLHIHQKGDLSGGCSTFLSHYNPLNQTHGGQWDDIRHVGDLGNVLADEDGNVDHLMADYTVNLCGEYSVIGRGIIIHDGTDDLGKGGDEESLISGNAGGRAACGVIGWA